MKSATTSLMPTRTTSAELSLINDSEFLEELQHSDPAISETASLSRESRPLNRDLYAALDRGLPVRDGVPEPEEPIYVDQPADAPFEPYDDAVPAPLAHAEPAISMFTAAIVIVACLTAGAATAAYVFQDNLARITALRSASH